MVRKALETFLQALKVVVCRTLSKMKPVISGGNADSFDEANESHPTWYKKLTKVRKMRKSDSSWILTVCFVFVPTPSCGFPSQMSSEVVFWQRGVVKLAVQIFAYDLPFHRMSSVALYQLS